MPTWDWLSKPIPLKTLRAIWIVLAAAAVIVICTTERRIPSPWQAVSLSAVTAVILVATDRIPDDAVRSTVDVFVPVVAIAFGQPLYPASIRHDYMVWWQFVAMMMLQVVLVRWVMHVVGLKPNIKRDQS